MDRESGPSVFGRLRSRPSQPREDEWYIPYKPTTPILQYQGGIGFSPPVHRTSQQSHNILSFLSTSSSTDLPVPTDRPYRFPRPSAPVPSTSRAPYSAISRTQFPVRPGPGPIAKSESFNSLNNVVPLAARIPSSTSVPTGLKEPKLLFSPLNREIRASLVQPLPEDLSYRDNAPRKRTVSAPKPQRQYPASQDPPTKWAAPTLCDMIVFPRPSILPHEFTPPGSPERGQSAWEEAVKEEARRTQEREAWANYVRQRGRSSSFGAGAAAAANRGGPIIGNYRVRSREHSQDRGSVGGEGRKRSSSLSARFGRRRSKSDAAEGKSRVSFEASKVVKTISCAPDRPRDDPNSSQLPFLTGDRDRDDRYYAATPRASQDASRRKVRHAHTSSSPDLRASASETPRIRSQPLKSLRIIPPVHEDRGDVVIIGPKPIPRWRSSLPRGAGDLDFSKPLPNLPPAARQRHSHRKSTPRLPLEDFEPLSREIDREMSMRSMASSQLEGPSLTLPVLPDLRDSTLRDSTASSLPALVPPSAQLRSSVASAAAPAPEDGVSGQAHARAVLAKQHQRSLNRRAFAAPVPSSRRGRDSTPTQSNLRASVRSANSVWSQPDYVYPSASSQDHLLAQTSTPPSMALPSPPVALPPARTLASLSSPAPPAIVADSTPGPLRKTTAMEDAIRRSRAGSMGNLDQLTPTAAKSGLRLRPRTADNEDRDGDITPRPPPAVAESSTARKIRPPPLVLTHSSKSVLTTSSASGSSKPSRAGSARSSSPLSPSLAHPISVVPSPQMPYGFEAPPKYLAVPTRPGMHHAESGASKSSGMTVFTDASEGWERDIPSSTQTPPPREKNESPDDVDSPDPNPDQDFQDLFFRTPHDPSSSPPTTQSKRKPIPSLPSDTSGVIGLGYDLSTSSGTSPSMPNSTSWPTVSSARSSRPISSGTLSGDSELATPLLMDLNAMRKPQITYIDAHTNPHQPPSNSSNATLASKLMEGYADRRASAGSMTSPRDAAAMSQESHQSGPSNSHEDFLLGEGVRGHMTSATLPADADPARRRSSAVEYSPTTFGISLPASPMSPPPFPPPDHSPPIPPSTSAKFEPLHNTPPQRPKRRSASFLPASPSAKYSPQSAQSSPRDKPNSAAVSFMSEFPTPPEVHSPRLAAPRLEAGDDVLRIRGGSSMAREEEHESAFGQVVTGPPGAGKTTYCYGMHQLLTALNRPVHIVNLDPAVPNPPYPCSINITELITLEEVMEEHGLGPNGAMLYCIEHLEENFDWLVERLDEVLGEANGGEGEGEGQEAYVIFDTPGQVELWTNHESLRRVIERLGKLDYRLAAVHLSDAHYITDASKFISATLLAMRAMMALELPHVNVLSKIDLLAQYGPLPFDLKYYTQAEDLSHLLTNLTDERGGEKMKRLNQAMVELIDQYGLVHWETCAVEDKKSMLHLIHVLDKATGYVFLPSSNAGGVGALLQSIAGDMPGWDVDDVQERWIDHREEWDAAEREGWQREGEGRRALADAGANASGAAGQ